MKYFTFITIFLVMCISSIPLLADHGDTTIIKTIQFQERREGWYDFPTDITKYQRIMMNYTLRCPPGKPCGEWDYLAYVYIHKFYCVNYRVDKSFPESFSYMKDTSFTFKWENNEITKTPKQSKVLYLYNDKSKPAIPTDSIIVWPTYYTFNFDSTGKIIDSTLVQPDTTINREIISQVFFKNDNTFDDVFELFRYITPYGINLDLGKGVNWAIDVSDFAQLLSGKVYITAPCGGWGDQYDQNTMEDLQLNFDYIEGTPPRNIIATTKLWDLNGIVYDKNIEVALHPYNFTFQPNEKNVMLRVVQTGHGFGGTDDNCAEFCRKMGYVFVNNEKKYEKEIWRMCGTNPVYPQGGTWIYDRSNWCPGAEVQNHDYEITPFLINGENIIDYNMEKYDLKWKEGSNTKPNWVIRGFLFTYSEPNFQNDARLINIISPNNDKMMNRFNPTIFEPKIEIQNTGKNPISSITIKLGNDPDNLFEYQHQFNQPLNIMEKATIIVRNINWFDENKPNKFYVEIVKVNDNTDEYQYNNKGYSYFEKNLIEIPEDIVVTLKTNNANIYGIPCPYYYEIKPYDKNNSFFIEKDNLSHNTTYQDSFKLKEGYYNMIIANQAGFGFSFWAMQQLTHGSLTISNNGAIYYNAPQDWGTFITVGLRVTPMTTLLTNIENKELDFGYVKLGEKKRLDVKIYPKNVKGLDITDVKISLGNNKKFTIIEEKSTASPNPRILSQNDTLTIVVEYEPLSEINVTAKLNITNNSKNEPFFVINLKGTSLSSIDNNYNYLSDFKLINNNEYINLLAKFENSTFVNKIVINDIYGNMIKSIDYNKMIENNFNENIDITNLLSGVYFVNVITNKGQLTEKFVVVK